MTRIIHHLEEIADRYDAVFCDVWGCLHDGRHPFDEAVAALRAFRQKGGAVILVTNAPRARAQVAIQLDRIGVPRDCWDVIATSGDSARVAMFEGAIGEKLHFIGSDSDLTVFEPLKLLDDPADIRRVPLADAEGIVCAGPEDPHADPAVYSDDFRFAIERGMKLLCLNPDIIVDVGEKRQWCAGALAQLYTEMGGDSLYFGKPHPPIYDLARRRLVAMGLTVPDTRILCIGDGIHTDVKGAVDEGLDALFVTGGLAAEETLDGRHPDPERLNAYLSREGLDPEFSIGFLR